MVYIPQDTHDLQLPCWGPYTKKYIGVSHVANKKKGLRFDLSVFPGFYRRRVDIPNVNWESGYHPWETAPDFSYFSHRHELEWKDQVYCDVSFSEMAPQARIARCECVNNTDLPQTLVMHFMASMQFPGKHPSVTVKLPDRALWVDALDYEELQFARPRPTDTLVHNGLWRGEVRGTEFVNGSALGTGFGKDAGDTVLYKPALYQDTTDAVLILRYRLPKEGRCVLRLDGPTTQTITLESGKCQIEQIKVPLGRVTKGLHQWRFTSLGGQSVEIDGFAITSAPAARAVSFCQGTWEAEPVISAGPSPQSLTLKYENVDHFYGLWWDYPHAEVRQFQSDDLDSLMRRAVHVHTRSVFKGVGDDHYTNVFLRPIEIKPQSSLTLEGLVCCGSEAEVRALLATQDKAAQAREEAVNRARKKAIRRAGTKAGRPYEFSQDRMAATLLSNVVFPIYTRGENIKHHTPGRWWDCLYTWDSGFIGLGLLELDLQRAVDSLNTYLTPAGDKHAAFIHHGSPIPVQIYLFHELWNRTQSHELLEFFYPRLRQYHRFLCGTYGSSTTNQLPLNLIKTWDYFYNSGGWDDYPPQVHVHRNKLTSSVAPVTNTAHAIRTAKLLRLAARHLGLARDIAEYDADIATFTLALQQHAWDSESGYFGYVCHDASGQPRGILRHSSGVNFNMGLDGATPLVAGACNAQQTKQLISHLSTPGRLWTSIGLSTVDQAAPYYRHDGYWNGAVWMPHQWFFWKVLLDLGETDLAYRIADTALQLWKREVEATYNCYEHFVVETSRGAGWHQFGGLSAPVLSWFGSYHVPGRLTVGFDTWIEKSNFSPENDGLEATLRIEGSPGSMSAIIVTLRPEITYTATWNDTNIPIEVLSPGTFHLRLPASCSGVLKCTGLR